MSTRRHASSSRDEFWKSVDAALDARRDPLADDRVVAWLGDHPDAAAELAELLARLDTLRAREPEPNASSRRVLRWVVLAAASLVAVLAAWAALRPAHAPARYATLTQTAGERFDPRAFRIERCSIELVTRTPESVQTTRVADGVIERRFATMSRGEHAGLATVVTRLHSTPGEEQRP